VRSQGATSAGIIAKGGMDPPPEYGAKNGAFADVIVEKHLGK
jgi:hypothetical protein